MSKVKAVGIRMPPSSGKVTTLPENPVARGSYTIEIADRTSSTGKRLCIYDCYHYRDGHEEYVPADYLSPPLPPRANSAMPRPIPVLPPAPPPPPHLRRKNELGGSQQSRNPDSAAQLPLDQLNRPAPAGPARNRKRWGHLAQGPDGVWRNVNEMYCYLFASNELLPPVARLTDSKLLALMYQMYPQCRPGQRNESKNFGNIRAWRMRYNAAQLPSQTERPRTPSRRYEPHPDGKIYVLNGYRSVIGYFWPSDPPSNPRLNRIRQVRYGKGFQREFQKFLRQRDEEMRMIAADFASTTNYEALAKDLRELKEIPADLQPDPLEES